MDSSQLAVLTEPDASLNVDENLIGLIAMLSSFTTDRRTMTDDQTLEWATMYEKSLMSRPGATLSDVFAAAWEWVESSRWFPTVSDLVPLVDKRIAARRDAESIAAAQRNATPVPALEGESDYEHVRTADLPPGYNYAEDPHWQRGIEMLQSFRESGQSDGLGLAPLLDQLDRNRTFQGASKPREVACPTCRGARHVRLGGYDPMVGGQKPIMGHAGSRYVMCPTCCPNGYYSEDAERDAIRAPHVRSV